VLFRSPLAAFLTASPSTHAFGEGPFCAPFPDIRAEMRELVARLARRGHEVLVVDCTTPLLKSLGLHAVKVLVPGLQPLNAGHRYRVLGGRRALELPRLLGLATRDMTTSELNPWPHPFW
jgi:ribosomal protein S12 methylthiotransferase accessory factor